jgi:L-ascorbate metabolism protein UlaG (beta-lactamase superfamily)
MSKKLLLALATAAALPFAATAAETAKTELTWYGQSAFVVKTPKGTVLAIDPWLSNPVAKDKDAAQKLTKVDYILISHGHNDHVGDAGDIAKRTGAKFVGSADLVQRLVTDGLPFDPKTMLMDAGNMGGSFALTDEVTVAIVPAVHSSGYKKTPESPQEWAGNPVGFVIKIKGGPTLYHTGDTDVFSDMSLIPKRWGHIDVMLACIGGHFTMDPAGAALAATFVKPKTIIPMHFGTFPLLAGTPAELQQALKSSGAHAKMTEMKVGETLTF